MTEFLPGIYKVLQKTDRGNTTEINIFIIPGKKGERSLMIDAGFQDENCLAQMEGVLKELDISYEDLDVFLTPIFDSQIYQNTAESLILPGFFSGAFSFYYIVFFLNQIWMIDFYDFSRDCLLSFWISFIFLLVRNS